MSRLPKWVSYVGIALIVLGMLWAVWVMGGYVVEKISELVHR